MNMIGRVTAAVVLAAAGLGLFVYGDLVGDRAGRTAGMALTTVAVVLTAILAAAHRSQKNQ
jgi:hypothetical protein